jgi:hypothetical protein
MVRPAQVVRVAITRSSRYGNYRRQSCSRGDPPWPTRSGPPPCRPARLRRSPRPRPDRSGALLSFAVPRAERAHIAWHSRFAGRLGPPGAQRRTPAGPPAFRPRRPQSSPRPRPDQNSAPPASAVPRARRGCRRRSLRQARAGWSEPYAPPRRYNPGHQLAPTGHLDRLPGENPLDIPDRMAAELAKANQFRHVAPLTLCGWFHRRVEARGLLRCCLPPTIQ